MTTPRRWRDENGFWTAAAVEYVLHTKVDPNPGPRLGPSADEVLAKARRRVRAACDTRNRSMIGSHGE